MFDEVKDECRAVIGHLNSIKSINRPYGVHASKCPSHLLKHYPDRNADAGAALFWQFKSHVAWQKRFKDLQHMQCLADKDVTNWHTRSVLALKLIGKLSEEDLKEAVTHSVSALCLMPVRLFGCLHGASGSIMKVWPSPSSSSQAAAKHELMQKCPWFKCQTFFPQELYDHQDGHQRQTTKHLRRRFYLWHFPLEKFRSYS